VVLDAEYPDIAQLGTITTVQEAMQALEDVSNITLATRHLYDQQIWPFWLRGSPAFLDRHHTQHRLQSLVDSIPVAWRQACADLTPLQVLHGPSQADVAIMLRDRLGWLSTKGKPLKLTAASVKLLTQLQLGPIQLLRQQKYQQFVREALQGPPDLSHQLANLQQRVLPMLRHMWLLPWDNNRKELLWRLVVDGVPSAARMHMTGDTCACGVVAPGRRHHFWECPVAVAVVAAIRQQLPGQPVVCCHHIWLAVPPACPVRCHRGVWSVVALAALLAMDKGRALLCKWKLDPPQRSLDQQLHAVKRVAVVSFWDMLQDFVALGMCPQPWLAQIGEAHPFLRVQLDANAAPHLRLHRVLPVQVPP
jgi:hypothetical protein